MLNSNNERELAYLVTVDSITPMDADRLECAHINGWQCVVGKGEFHAGDIGIYFEIDSQLPDVEPFSSMEFLRSKHFKIKSQKIRGVISQGLLMPVSAFGWTTGEGEMDMHPTCAIELPSNEIHKLDDETRFLTKRLDITYAVPEDNVRKASSADKYKKMSQRHVKLARTAWWRWLYRRNWGKKLLFAFFGKKRDKKNGWPQYIKKTDEERIECIPYMLHNKEPFVATEKIDGTSTTFSMKRGKFGKNEFYICSRNVVFDKPDKQCFYDTNVYTEMAEKYNIEEVLSAFLKVRPDVEWVTLQGETYGAGVQKRDYSIADHRFAGFNFITSTDGRWNSVAAAEYCTKAGIPWVPILDTNYTLPDTIEELREYVHSKPSCLDGIIKEGIVFRSQDGATSFKCVDPEFLLKYHS